MATVRGADKGGEATTVTIVARSDRVLLPVGTEQAVLLSVEQAGDLLTVLRTEFHHAASAKLDSVRPRSGRRTARPGGTGDAQQDPPGGARSS